MFCTGHHQTKIQKLREGRINAEVNFFMQYLNTHSFEITPILKTGYSNDQQKLYRIQNPKLGKKCFNKNALMECEYLNKWIGTVTCQRMLNRHAV